MDFTVTELAERVGGTVIGDGQRRIEAALPLAQANDRSITFIADQRRLESMIAQCAAAAVLVPAPCNAPIAQIVVDNPMAAMLTVAALFHPPYVNPPGVDPRAAIAPDARIGPDCYVGPFAVVESNVTVGPRCRIHPHAVIRQGCILGADVEIHPHAVLYPDTQVGDRTIVHAGSVIGCDGFGYQFVDGRHRKIPQLGRVELGADIEIGANSSVDRATFGATRVGEGTKIDNLVQIGHNCVVGKHNIFVAFVGMGGSCTTGDYAVFAGQVGVPDHLNIGQGAVLGANCKPIRDVPAGERVLGIPARPEREAKRMHLAMEYLPEMRQQLRRVMRTLGLDDSDGASRNKRAAG